MRMGSPSRAFRRANWSECTMLAIFFVFSVSVSVGRKTDTAMFVSVGLTVFPVGVPVL